MSDQTRRWTERFQAMEQEWREIHQRNMRDVITAWEQAMMEMSREYQDLVSRGKWVSGPSDFFSIIERAEDERTHSRMLAWLLTPTGRHGLRYLFLKGLLGHYDSKHGNAYPPQVRPIVRTVDRFSRGQDNREADVVVWGEDFTLVIEMKVNAGEPDGQCDDLYERFKAEPCSRFLFLTRKGDEPETATTPDAKQAFETIPWSQVRCMIEAALNDPVSRQGSAVAIVKNYVLTLKEQFG